MLRLWALLGCFVLLLNGCGNSGATTDIGRLPDDSTTPPPAGPDTTTPGVDTVPPGPDTTSPPPPPPPPDTTGPAPKPTHVGIPFGPFFVPSDRYGPEYTGTYRPRLSPETLLSDLEAARRANMRVFLNLTGNERGLHDENGFSYTKWKSKVDAFRGLDISSYIADGTIIGHYILDEPQDRKNWGGDVVTPAEIDELARYSKEIWPDMAAVVRAWPDYLHGYTYKYLDAAWAQYCPHCGNSSYRLPIETFISKMVRDAQTAGVALVGGLNVLDGGSENSGIPGRKEGKFAMSASEIREWGAAYIENPYICGFLLWEYEEPYFSRPDIREAVADLKQRAERHEKKECRP